MVRIVTDSSSDIPHEVALELGITVVPVYVRFGDELYRDGVDIDADQFYHKLERSRMLPKTSTPSPGDFVQCIDKLAREADEILSIHLSSRYSSVCNAAIIGRSYLQRKCTVEVADSRSVSMGCGLIAIAAAKAAKKGANLNEVMTLVNNTILRTHIIGMVTNIRYILSGKRLSLPGWDLFLAKLGQVLSFKLLGEIYEAGKLRGRGMFLGKDQAFARLERILREQTAIETMSILYAKSPDWAQDFSRRIGLIFPREQLYSARLGCVTGIHSGPEAVAIAFTEGRITSCNTL